jgi:hypothetical protein
VVYTVKGDAWGTVRVTPDGGSAETIRYPEGTTLIVDGDMVHLPAGRTSGDT